MAGLKSESMTDFTPEWWPESFRNGGRNDSGIVTGLPRNPQVVKNTRELLFVQLGPLSGVDLHPRQIRAQLCAFFGLRGKPDSKKGSGGFALPETSVGSSAWRESSREIVLPKYVPVTLQFGR